MMSFPSRVGLAVALLAAAACDSGLDDDPAGTDAGATSAACQEAKQHSDLDWIQDNIFTRSCALSGGCHGGPTPAAQLNMEAGQSEAELVDQVAVSDAIAGQTLVIPGDDTGSYLMVIIDHESQGGRLAGPLPPRGTMPLGFPLMCVEKRDAIARWIRSL